MPVQRQTRLTRIKEEEAKKSLVRYVILTISLIAFLALVGLPFLIPRLTGFIDETTGRSMETNSNDTTPPPPPNLRDVPQYSNEESVDIRGTTEPGANVFIIVNGRDIKLIADAEGAFSTIAELQEDENEVYAFAEDQAGNKSNDSNKYKIVVDKESPEIEITSPKDGSIFFGQESTVQIEGQTETNASVKVNERVAIVNREGKFNVRVNLNEGANNFDIIATDQAGNETKVTLTLSYTP